LLADKLVSIVAIHPLVGSRANRLHMPNPQLGVAQATQDRDPQATSNPLELSFVISHGEGRRTPQNPSGDGHEQLPTRANAPTLLQAVRWRQPPRVTRNLAAHMITSAIRSQTLSKCTRITPNLTKMMNL
jgi:hypothetical protein